MKHKRKKKQEPVWKNPRVIVVSLVFIILTVVTLMDPTFTGLIVTDNQNIDNPEALPNVIPQEVNDNQQEQIPSPSIRPDFNTNSDNTLEPQRRSSSGGGGGGGGGAGGFSGGGNPPGVQGNNTNNNTNSTNSTNITTPPAGNNTNLSKTSIALLSPLDNSGDVDGNVTFSFIITKAQDAATCGLFIDNQAKYKVDPNDFTKNNISVEVTNLSLGIHAWHVACFVNSQEILRSQTWHVSVIPGLNFSGSTTNLAMVNVQNITNLTLEVPESGKITFNENVNLSAGANLNQYVSIENNQIVVQSSMIPELNKSATLTLYNLSFDNPIILLDGNVCQDCPIINETNNIVFNVDHFSSYSVSENARLEVFDDTDNQTFFAGPEIRFFANYTNITDNTPITDSGFTCVIDFNDTAPQNMTYNTSTTLYTYERSFVVEGVFFYNVTCDGSGVGFSSLNVTDLASINEFNGPDGVRNLTVVEEHRANLSNTPDTDESYSGNVSELNVYANVHSSSWQGYYGSIAWAFQLADSGGNTLYNWTVTNPTGEIYATRAFDVNFPTMKCMNVTEIEQEESFLGHTNASGESVNNTFNRTTHPAFQVGTLSITQDSCRSTNLFVNSTAQFSTFHEVLLSDGASNPVYTALLESNSEGFNNGTYDFQMMVGENGRDNNTATTTYYFFVEIS